MRTQSLGATTTKTLGTLSSIVPRIETSSKNSSNMGLWPDSSKRVRCRWLGKVLEHLILREDTRDVSTTGRDEAEVVTDLTRKEPQNWGLKQEAKPHSKIQRCCKVGECRRHLVQLSRDRPARFQSHRKVTKHDWYSFAELLQEDLQVVVLLVLPKRDILGASTR